MLHILDINSSLPDILNIKDYVLHPIFTNNPFPFSPTTQTENK